MPNFLVSATVLDTIRRQYSPIPPIPLQHEFLACDVGSRYKTNTWYTPVWLCLRSTRLPVGSRTKSYNTGISLVTGAAAALISQLALTLVFQH